MKTYFAVQKMVSNVEAAKSDLEVGQKQREGFMYKIKLGSAWSHLHSTIANPLDFRPLASDPIEARMKAFFGRALSTTLANITFDTMENVDELEVYPSRIPDLLSESPLIVSGRYKGDFPETLKARGILADMSNFVVDLKVQKAKDIPIDKVLAKQEIDLLTDQAWFSENKELEEKIARMSVKYGIVSEYTCMILLETERGKNDTESTGALEGCGSSKRKLVDVNPVSETPKLFTSAFKVPKLKNSSCLVI